MTTSPVPCLHNFVGESVCEYCGTYESADMNRLRRMLDRLADAIESGPYVRGERPELDAALEDARGYYGEWPKRSGRT